MAQDWPKHPVLVDCLVVSRGKLSGRTKAKFEVLPMAWPMLQNYQATSVNAEGLQIGIQNPSVFSARCTFWKLSQSVPLERGALNQAAMSRNDKVACMKRYEQISKKHGCCEVWVQNVSNQPWSRGCWKETPLPVVMLAVLKPSFCSNQNVRGCVRFNRQGPKGHSDCNGTYWDHIQLVRRLQPRLFLNLSQAHWHGTNTCKGKKTWSLEVYKGKKSWDKYGPSIYCKMQPYATLLLHRIPRCPSTASNAFDQRVDSPFPLAVLQCRNY